LLPRCPRPGVGVVADTLARPRRGALVGDRFGQIGWAAKGAGLRGANEPGGHLGRAEMARQHRDRVEKLRVIVSQRARRTGRAMVTKQARRARRLLLLAGDEGQKRDAPRRNEGIAEGQGASARLLQQGGRSREVALAVGNHAQVVLRDE
jgi:hypothetical protein